MHINDLTLICGLNNTGKTYISYAIYSILTELENLIEAKLEESAISELIEILDSEGIHKVKINGLIQKLNEKFIDANPIIDRKVSKFFDVPESHFSDSKISLTLDGFNTKEKLSYLGFDYQNLITIDYIFENGDSFLKFEVRNEKANGESEVDESFLQKFNGNVERAAVFLNNAIKKIIYRRYLSKFIPRPFPITSERTGISLFYKSFDSKNNQILAELGESEKMISNQQLNAMRSLHALPIEDNINNVRIYSNVKDVQSFFVDKDNEFNGEFGVINILNELLDDGSFSSANGTLLYQPSENSSEGEPTIPLHIASSSIKSLFLFDMYIKNIAAKNDILVIDEPELNLHTTNQVKVARLIARIVNSGIKVLVTTHSDFILRELNNLIMMNSISENKRKKLCKDFDITDYDLLDMNKVSAYESTLEGKINEIEVTKSGIDLQSLEHIIDFENDKAFKIYEETELADEE